MGGILYTIISVLVAFWLIGFILHIGGAFIHILLLIAGVVFIFQLVTGKRAV